MPHKPEQLHGCVSSVKRVVIDPDTGAISIQPDLPTRPGRLPSLIAKYDRAYRSWRAAASR